MKNIFIILGIILIFGACSTNTKEADTSSENDYLESTANLVTHTFKLEGLQDSIVKDSIWRMIFNIDGIDKLILTNEDSLAVFTVNPEQVTLDDLKKEIEQRGGKLLN